MVDAKKGTPGAKSSEDVKTSSEGAATRRDGRPTEGPESSVDRHNTSMMSPAAREGFEKQEQEDAREGIDRRAETERNRREPAPATAPGEPFQPRRAPPSAERSGLVFFNRTALGTLRVMTEIKDPTSGEWGRGPVGELRQDDTMAVALDENSRLVIERV